MKTHALFENALPPSDMRHLIMETAMVRAKQEHELLTRELQDIYELACSVRSDVDAFRLNREIRRLNVTVKHFLTEWNTHTRWEESEFLPYAAWYLGAEPDLFAWMEHEYELAEQFIRAFLQTLDRAVVPVPQEEAYRMVSYLLQAYAVLKNRFAEEEEIMLALTDVSNPYDF